MVSGHLLQKWILNCNSCHCPVLSLGVQYTVHNKTHQTKTHCITADNVNIFPIKCCNSNASLGSCIGWLPPPTYGFAPGAGPFGYLCAYWAFERVFSLNDVEWCQNATHNWNFEIDADHHSKYQHTLLGFWWTHQIQHSTVEKHSWQPEIQVVLGSIMCGLRTSPFTSAILNLAVHAYWLHGGAAAQLPTDSDWKQLSVTVFDLDCAVS